MKWLALCILAVILVATESKVVPASDVENQQTGTPSQESTLADHFTEAKNIISNLGTELQKHIQENLPNQGEFMNTLQEHTNNFANNLNTYLQNMTAEIKTKSPELENIWSNLQTKLSQMADRLTINVDPQTTEQVNQLRTKFQEGVQTLVTESENTAKAISENSAKVQEGIAKFTKQAIDIAVQASQNLNNQLQQATTPQP